MPAFPREAAAYAEYVTARSRELAATPAELSDVEAGALPLAGLTAWQGLVDTAGVTAGQRVLVHAAAGGVGHLAVQIAKSLGAEVIGTARATHHDWLTELGADRLIDYTGEDVAESVDEVDLVLDLVGGDVGLRSLPVLREGGLLIAIPSGRELEPLREAAGDRVRVTNMLVEPDRTGMEALAALVRAGGLRVHVARTFPLADAAAAHALGERGAIGGGKLVLTPGSR
jgi:NADPH:quinone reductase-like Zn-dependent oxidoreductase